MRSNKMFQVSTLQALSLGYTRPVIKVSELLKEGDTGIGTFESVNGEMIVVDGKCYQANEEGDAYEADPEVGVPFASVVTLKDCRSVSLQQIPNLEALKTFLMQRIEEDYGLNSMHIAKIDGLFPKIHARSESPLISQHVPIKEMLAITQNEFEFSEAEGTLICIYYPDYMSGINASGWHVHYISKDRTKGGHVFDVNISSGELLLSKINSIEIELPKDPAFDTYSLHEVSAEEIREVEQNSGR